MKFKQSKNLSVFSRTMLWLCDHFEGLRFVQSVLGLCILGIPFALLMLHKPRFLLQQEHEALLILFSLFSLLFLLLLGFLWINSDVHINSKSLKKKLLFLIILSALTYYGVLVMSPGYYGKYLPQILITFLTPCMLFTFLLFIVGFLFKIRDCITQINFPCSKLISFLFTFIICTIGFVLFMLIVASIPLLLELLMLAFFL